MQGYRRSALDDLYPLRREIIFGGEQGALRAPPGTGPMSIDVAKKLEATNEVSASDIFNQTGWYRGPDQQWKWTLSDEGARLNLNRFKVYKTGVDGLTEEQAAAKPDQMMLQYTSNNRLSDILNHPALFATYPQLKDVNVERLPADESGGAVAEYNAGLNRIRLADGRTHQDVLSSILHEVQHRVQQEEGFGAGGNLYMFYPEDVKSGKRRPTKEEYNKAFDDYEKTSGETEARQVQSQLKNQDWSRLPTQMEGFPAPADQIVRRSGQPVISGKSYQLVPVDHDPFVETSPRLVPVDHDPFADPFRQPSPAEIIGMGLPTFGGGSALGTPGVSSPAGGSQPSLSSMSPPGGDGSGGPPQQNNFRPPSGTSL